MRSSVARKTKKAVDHTRRLVIVLFVVLVAACCGLFLAFSNWQAHAVAHSQDVALAQLEKQIADALQARIDTAKQAESEAKARADTYQTTLSERPSMVASSPRCDVSEPHKITVVVNKKHCFEPITWEPTDLIEVEGFYLRKEAAESLQNMLQAASNDGVSFLISSAYRSYDDQVTTYADWIAVSDSQASADAISARPGYSEHQTGLAVDFKLDGCVLECFGTKAQYAWLALHADEYGFIRRYPPGLTSITGYMPEAWHWRYVGTALAQNMQTQSIETLEAYFAVTGGDYSDR